MTEFDPYLTSNYFRRGISMVGLIWITFNLSFAQSPMQAGMAQLDITPLQKEYPHYRGPSTGVHDSLYAKAIVISQGKEQIALVVCDLLWIERDLSSRVRMEAAAKTKIPFENILLAGTHTHTSPAYHPNIQELTGELRPPFDPQENLDEQDTYPTWLGQRIVQAIVQAQKNAVPVDIGFGKGMAEGISFNRRFIMHDGKVRTNAGVGNPEIVRAAGPVDKEMGIIWFNRAVDKEPLGSLTNFAIHADTFGGTEFSADYPGFLAQSLVDAMNGDFVSVFAPGTCGDINHVDVNSKERRSSEDIGRELTNIVTSTIPQLQTLASPMLASTSEIAFIPLQHYSKEELEWANDENANPLYRESEFLERRRRLKIRSLERIRRFEAVPPTIAESHWKLPLEVQVFRLGKELAIVGLPGEVFVEFGLAIKEASPFETTLVIELTNSHIAYVPTQAAFTQGGYETVNSRVAPGGGELLVQTALKLLHELSF